MIQKKGIYGNINSDGTRDGLAGIYNNRDKDFLDEVEDGMKSIVSTCIDVGIDTFSACQGHIYSNETTLRYLTIVIDSEYYKLWEEYINKINIKYNIDLKSEIDITADLQGKYNSILNYDYKAPIGFRIFILETQDKSIEYITSILEKSIKNKEFPRFI